MQNSNSNVDGGPTEDGSGDTNDDGSDYDDSNGESSAGADEHKNDGNDYDYRCLDSIKKLR